MNRKKLVAVLLALCIIIAAVPLLMINDSEFGGSDGQAEELITEINPNYQPWAESWLEPPGGETEGLLFSLQAAFGGGILGLGFGYLIGRRKASKS